MIETSIKCKDCGYSLRGLADHGECPECGTPIRHSLLAYRIEGTSPISLRVPVTLYLCLVIVNAVWAIYMYWLLDCELWFSSIAGLNVFAGLLAILVMITAPARPKIAKTLPELSGFVVMVGLLMFVHFAVFIRVCAR